MWYLSSQNPRGLVVKEIKPERAPLGAGGKVLHFFRTPYWLWEKTKRKGKGAVGRIWKLVSLQGS